MKRKKYVPKKKAKRNIYLYFLGALIVLIMVGGAINMDSDDDGDSYDYKGIKFVRMNEGWSAYLDDGRQIFVLSNPAELNNLTISNVYFSGLNNLEKIYITYNPEERVRTALSQFYNGIKLTPRKVPACTVDIELCADVPIKTCEDATETVGIVEFKQSNVTKVEFNNNCLLIQGEDLTKIVDKLILEQL
ncbi:MAG: hypothetical protein KKB39_00955 [Nanoarchaeota archaeon]|nr:hypothetical protein [Nanoarchaeota archaeon]